ncbi:sulfonate ABC transporter substrate-binding protein [Microbispora corallina]|uniref:Sulfonate ABC transporter substrate-binding protein n=1 Tax=Microbispora corallina TaxID=83302 RepID=A0ABQ4FWZ9_9ACTN|nr:ABC transporter substrate-binding protein [Microbispora corallina]GIH39339.1 sulfonate ABC transporter substrate-binding protein [Microbispora corallina]
MTVRIGVHNHNPSLFFLSRLEHVLDDIGEPVELYFYADPARTCDLLAEGAVDIGGTGSVPPLAGQAAGLPIVYAAVSAPRPGRAALLVAPDGPVRSVADLRDRPVALVAGSWQTHFLAALLDRHGLSYQDIEPRPAGPEAREWLRTGEVAAWVAQGADLVEAEGGLRTLSGTLGVVADRSVFTTRRDFAEGRPEAVAAVARGLRQADAWARANLREAAHLTVEAVGGSVDSWEMALARLPWRLEPVTPVFVAEQQEAADVLYAGRVLADRVRVRAAVVPSLEPYVGAALAGDPVPAAAARPPRLRSAV